MGSLKAECGYSVEILTEILDEPQWWRVMHFVIEHLRSRGNATVSVQ